MSDLTGLLAYLGPETMLPMTSAVAGVIGVVMLVGRGSLRWASNVFRGLVRRPEPRSSPKAGSRRIGKGPVGSIASTSKKRAES